MKIPPGIFNAAVVHGKFTFLSGEICMSCDRSVMREGRNRFTRLTKNPAYPFAVDGYESPLRETQSRQHLMISPIALRMATCGVSVQKSAEGIVLPVNRKEGLNAERSGASNELDVGIESDRMSQASARHGIAFPRSGLNVSVVYIVERDLIRLRPDDFHEPPTAPACRQAGTRMVGGVGRDG